MAHLYDLWVPDTNNNKILKIVNGVVTKEIAVGNKPRAICVSLNGIDIFVTNMADNTVTWIQNGERIKDIAVGKIPMGIVVDKTGAAWTANYGSNTISKISSGFKVLEVAVGNGPRGICVDENNALYVANFLSNNVSKIVEGTKLIDIVVGSNPYGLCSDKYGYVWVANSGSNTVSKIYQNKKIQDIQVGNMPYGICVNTRNEVYVSNYLGDTLSKIVNSKKTQYDIPVGDGPHGICVDKDNVVYVANTNSNKISKVVNDVVVGYIEVCYNPINFGDSTGMQQYILFETLSESKKINFDDLSYDLQQLISSGGVGEINATQVIYDNLDYPNVDLALDELLYTNPDITSFTNNVNTVEIGSIVDNVNLNWVVNKTMTSQSINNGVGVVPVGTTTKALIGLGLTTDTSWTLTVTDSKNIATKSTSVVFRNKRYWGVSDKTSLTDAEIIALEGKEFSTSRAQSRIMNASGGKYLYFVMPTSFACDPSKFKVGGLFNSDWTVVNRAFVNAGGHSVQYSIFRSGNIQTGSAISVDIV